MTMSNEEKDKVIKETLQKDKFTATKQENMKKDIKDDFIISNIKPKKYTYFQRTVTKVLVLILIVSVALNVYFIKFGGTGILVKNPNLVSKNDGEDNLAKPIDITDNLISENKTVIENTITENEVSASSEIENVIVEDKTSEKQNYALDLDTDLLKEEFAVYGLTIGRFEGNIDSLEENTVLLLMSANSFAEKRTPSGLDNFSSKYAMSMDNVHKFIKELTGIENTTPIQSYTNYIGYNDISKAYVYGKNSNILSNEKYEVTKVSLKNKDGSGYTVEGTIEKTVNTQKYYYDFESTILINTEYTYMPYRIRTFTYNIKNGAEDNVVRLVDNPPEELQKNNGKH